MKKAEKKEIVLNEIFLNDPYHLLDLSNENQSNDWHYPSEGDLPEFPNIQDHDFIPNILMYTKSKTYLIGYRRLNKFGETIWCRESCDLLRPPIAWQYLPKPPRKKI